MKYGLDDKIIQQINTIFIQYTEIKEVVIYGSRVKGTYKVGSDIDLTLKAENLSYATLLEIENKLDDLLLPYKIDLSDYQKITNSDLISHINRMGKIFYKRD